MSRVAIIGAGTTPFRSRHPDRTYYELAYDAALAAYADAGLERDDIECAVYGMYNDFFARQYQPDAFVHDYLGLAPRPACRVNTGGATGGSALRIGFAEVASGLYDLVLVLGVEKCADCFDYGSGTAVPEVLRAILYTSDMTYDNPIGRTAASGFGLAVLAHMEHYGGPTEEQMAKVSVKNHGNALKNPVAQAGMEITVEDVLNSPRIVEPFKRLDNCLYTEGATAVVLASERKVRDLTLPRQPVWITGVGAALDWVFPGNRPNIYEFGGCQAATRRSYEMAGITNPLEEIDLAELHDAFTGTEIMSYEDCGLCPPGEGGRLIDDGTVWPGGKLPVNLSGGLIGCGHAVGATGLMQTMEIVLHLRGAAGERQVPNARRGLVQSIGGTLCSWTASFVLEA